MNLKKPMLLGLLMVLGLSFAIAGVKADSVYDYDIVSVTQVGTDTIVVTVQANFCTSCSLNQRFVEVEIVSSLGLFDVKQKLGPPLDDTIWPRGVLVTKDFTFTGLPLRYCDYVSVFADFWCALCDHHYATKTNVLHIIPEYPLGTIMGVFAGFAAIGVFAVRSKRYKLSLIH